MNDRKHLTALEVEKLLAATKGSRNAQRPAGEMIRRAPQPVRYRVFSTLLMDPFVTAVLKTTIPRPKSLVQSFQTPAFAFRSFTVGDLAWYAPEMSLNF